MPMRILAALLVVAVARAEELNDRTFDAWVEKISPREDELAWRAIPWRTAFCDAVVEAQEAGKPLLIWAMNGHPLGCT